MSSVEVKFAVDDPLASWSEPLGDWLACVEKEIARVRALSGIKGARICTTYQALWGYTGIRNSVIHHAVELSPRSLGKALQAFAKDFPDYTNFQSINYAPTRVALELDFQDPDKAMLFKLSV